MKPTELVEKIVSGGKEYPDKDRISAKIGFLANLATILRIPLPVECLDDPEDRMRDRHFLYFYAGIIVGYGNEIDDKTIKDAHCMMMFPFTRAIISNCLGHRQVTALGVPSEYGV